MGVYIKKANNLNSTVISLVDEDYYQMRKALVKYFDEYKKEKYIDKEHKDNSFEVDISVPFISQLPDYPNGCEAASAVMLLKAYGIDITLAEFIEEYMDKDVIYRCKLIALEGTY